MEINYINCGTNSYFDTYSKFVLLNDFKEKLKGCRCWNKIISSIEVNKTEKNSSIMPQPYLI